MQVAAWTFLLIERNQNSRRDRFFRQAISLALRAVAPYNRVGPSEQGDFLDPILERLASRRRVIFLGIRRHLIHSTWGSSDYWKKQATDITEYYLD
jgi:hypothetical protein